MENSASTQKPGGFTAFLPIVTFILVGINIAVFALEFILSFTDYSDLLTYMGAKIGVLIAAGQYWRLITPVVLHSGFDHLLSNTIALLIWGKQVEYIIGRVRFITVYITAGICGSLLSFAFSDSISVGASGAIFGLFGVFLYLMRRRKGLFNGPFAIQVLMIIGINLFSGFVNPRVDNLGHIGGLIGGYLCSRITGIRGDKRFTPVRALFLTLLLLLMGLAFWLGMRGYAT